MPLNLARFLTLVRWTLGVGLPLFAFGFELTTHQFSGGAYDIMPTPWHALLWLCMPVSFVLVELQTSRRLGGSASFTGFLHGVSFPVILLHAVAVGQIVIAGLFMLGAIFVYAFLPLLHEPINFTVTCELIRDYLGNSIVACTPLTLLSLWIVNLWRWARGGTIQIGALAFGLAVSLIILAALELSVVRIHGQVVRAIGELGKGEQPTEISALQSAKGEELIARLAFSRMQGSSASHLYAVGPVDVFGALVFILDGRRPPIHASSDLTMKRHLMPQLFQLVRSTGSPTKPIAWSWRGLSRWEFEEIERQSSKPNSGKFR